MIEETYDTATGVQRDAVCGSIHRLGCTLENTYGMTSAYQDPQQHMYMQCGVCMRGGQGGGLTLS